MPFNIKLFRPTKERIQRLKPVTVLDIHDGATNNFHEDGLFSPSIFGRVGSDQRDTNFSYIDAQVEVFHPMLFRNLVRLKALYKGIMEGTTMAEWDNEIKDFVLSDDINGQTGFNFFISHWRDIVFPKPKSAQREERIKLIEEFKDIALVSKILVIPAGLRDVEYDDDGRVTQDPINDMYRRVIGLGNTLRNVSDLDSSVTDQARLNIQRTFNEIFNYLAEFVSGKGGFIQKKWISRRIYHGTANVITSMDPTSASLGSANSVDVRTTFVGLYQMVKSIEPITVHLLRTGFVSDVFNTADTPATLVNKKTLKREEVLVSPRSFDRWNTEEGLVKVITSLEEPAARNQPIEIDGYYMGLIYRGNDNTFKLIHSIDDVPQLRLENGTVTPLTLFQLIYLSGYSQWNDYPGMITRYPVTGLGSTYPTFSHVRTTIKSETRRELDYEWESLEGEEYLAKEFPTDTEEFFDSLSPHPSRLPGLGGDFDGDRCNFNAFFTDESVAEVNAALNEKNSFIDPKGGFRTSIDSDVTNLVLYNMTGE